MAVKLLGDLSASGNATFNSEVNLPSGGQIDWANGDARIIEGAVTNYSLSLQTYTGSALTTKMFIASGGNVGIGTTSPSEKLHVVGNGIFHSGANLGTIKVGRGANQEIEIYVDDTNNIITAYQDSDGNSSHVFALNREFDGSGANYFEIRKGGSAQMHIDTSGNVGIGTTAPLEKLHVAGKINSSNNIVSNSTYTMFTGRSSRTVDDYGGLNKEYFKANLVTPGSGTTGEASAHGIADLRFQLANSAGNTGMSDIMTLRSGGNVGIGTTTPLTKLHVEGGVTINTGNGSSAFNDLNIGGINGWSNSEAHRINFVYGNGTSNIFQTIESYYGGANEGKMRFRNFYTDSQQTGILMTIHSSGNVGIGTDSPASKLHVSDATNISMGSGGEGQFRVEGSGYTGAIALDGTAMYIYHNSASRNLVLGTDETASITIHKSNQTLTFNAYGAGILKTDASGNVSLDTNTYSTATGVANNADVTPSWVPATDPGYSTLVIGTTATTAMAGNTTIPSGSQLVRVLQNQNYVLSDGGSSGNNSTNRANYGTGLTIYEGYNVGTNRPFTYDTTAQFMSTTSQGFELSIDWVSASNTPLKIRSLRDCCQGWNPWTEVYTEASFSKASVLNSNVTLTSLGAAPLASPALTGTPTAPTAGATVNTTQLATTAFVQTAIANLSDSAPDTLNTLNELAAALGDDASFSTTVTNSIAAKLPLAGAQ